MLVRGLEPAEPLPHGFRIVAALYRDGPRNPALRPGTVSTSDALRDGSPFTKLLGQFIRTDLTALKSVLANAGAAFSIGEELASVHGRLQRRQRRARGVSDRREVARFAAVQQRLHCPEAPAISLDLSPRGVWREIPVQGCQYLEGSRKMDFSEDTA